MKKRMNRRFVESRNSYRPSFRLVEEDEEVKEEPVKVKEPEVEEEVKTVEFTGENSAEAAVEVLEAAVDFVEDAIGPQEDYDITEEDGTYEITCTKEEIPAVAAELMAEFAEDNDLHESLQRRKRIRESLKRRRMAESMKRRQTRRR